MNIKKVITITIFVFLTSCGMLSEGFKSSKQNKSDEFLVEKKSPLVMPPDSDQLPEPKNSTDKTSLDEKSIKNLINKKKIISTKAKSDLEGSILEQLKKN